MTEAERPSAKSNPTITSKISSRTVLLIAAPVALSNATVPLQGAVDTAIIGDLGVASAQAAVGIGAELFSLLLASFNFLQIGVSGLSAQALGAGRIDQVADTLARGLLIGLTIAAALMLLRAPLLTLGLGIFEGSAEAEGLAARYFEIRIFAAPAELANYALLGWFAGQGVTRKLFQHQIVLASANIGLSVLFVVGLDWGVPGVALGTLIAAYLALAYGLFLARGRLRAMAAALPDAPRWRPRAAILLAKKPLLRMLALNRDLFIRTMLLVGAFAWMSRLGSLQGDVMLAANVVLFQFFIFSAFLLDGFAIAAEGLVGQAVGARNVKRFDQAAAMTSLWSGLLALAVAGLFTLLSGPIIDLFTKAPNVREQAQLYAFWASLIPIIGFWAFQLDGIFIGATGSVEMRNSMIAVSLVYFPMSWAFLGWFGNDGVWAAIWVWLLLRAATLAALYPRLRARATATLNRVSEKSNRWDGG